MARQDKRQHLLIGGQRTRCGIPVKADTRDGYLLGWRRTDTANNAVVWIARTPHEVDCQRCRTMQAAVPLGREA